MSVFAFDIRAKGSPPHTRGKAVTLQKHRSKNGITPAHAGKSPFHSIFTPFQVGSPPHTRGKDNVAMMQGFNGGITPAHAGKRSQPCSVTTDGRDHPRTRGEKVRQLFRVVVVVGSPPHTRGKEVTSCVRAVRAGITPAHAGKSGCRPAIVGRRGDHPRTRGEKTKKSR